MPRGGFWADSVAASTSFRVSFAGGHSIGVLCRIATTRVAFNANLYCRMQYAALVVSVLLDMSTAWRAGGARQLEMPEEESTIGYSF